MIVKTDTITDVDCIEAANTDSIMNWHTKTHHYNSQSDISSHNLSQPDLPKSIARSNGDDEFTITREKDVMDPLFYNIFYPELLPTTKSVDESPRISGQTLADYRESLYFEQSTNETMSSSSLRNLEIKEFEFTRQDETCFYHPV